VKNGITDLFMPLTRILLITTNWQQSGQACFSDAGTRLYFPVPYLPLTHVTSHSMLHVLESRIYLVPANMLIKSSDISERLGSCRMTGTQALCTTRWCAVWTSRSRLIEIFFYLRYLVLDLIQLAVLTTSVILGQDHTCSYISCHSGTRLYHSVHSPYLYVLTTYYNCQ
jgi:hypothetical protein